jgi:hypothetical protein
MTLQKTDTNLSRFTGANSQGRRLDPEVPAQYIRENFDLTDRLAVVLIQRETNRVIQRVSTAGKIASPEFQAWLRHANASGQDPFIGMNALHESSRTRTRGDVATIRHVYLDFDENGTAAILALLNREDLPGPNYLVNTSPDRWHAVWKAEGFQMEEAERLMRHLVRETGADPAATDSSRVLRLPGFVSHKHAGKPFVVGVESHASQSYRPEHFPKVPAEEQAGRGLSDRGGTGEHSGSSGGLSQSERDWAYAKRALARGDSPPNVIAEIARFRAGEKGNPADYADRTVRKAMQSLDAERFHASNVTELPR